MPVNFKGYQPGDRLAPGSRIRTVWLLTTGGEFAAGVNPFADSTDKVTQGAQQIIAGLTTRQLGYALNVPPAIKPGDLGVVLDIRTSSNGNGFTAAELASYLDDLPGFATIALYSLEPIPSGESSAAAIAARDAAATAANTAAKDALPSGVLAGAADSIGQGATNLVTFIKYAGILALIVLGVWAWRTYGPRK